MSEVSRNDITCIALGMILMIGFVMKTSEAYVIPHRILLDTDMGSDDIFALLYILKLNRSEFDLQAITINANSWTDAGHAVNLVYDILYMMDRDDIAVGVGGEGGIREDSTITRDVGGYLPMIEQRSGTAGYCRYRQAVPVGLGGRLDADTNFGYRRSFLPQGIRKYSPLKQPTVQQVMINKISAGPTNVFITGALTNFAIFLMKNPHLKRNVEHIYIMGGGSYGNLFTDLTSNPYGEFNIFLDPFAAYQVIHSGIPVTLIPVDATSTIPISHEFFEEFEKNQHTYEAQYCFKGLKMARDTWFDDNFYTSYFMWDPFMAGVATSIMRMPNNHQGQNEFSEMKFVNMTVVTSNKPYGISDGSNPFFDGLKVPRFNLTREGVHSGHVQTGLRDPFCHVDAGNGKCKDGYTAEVTDDDSVQINVAVKAKPSHDGSGVLNREFYKSYLDVLNKPHQSGKFNFTTQFPNYREIMYVPYLKGRTLGKNVVFDMDMSAGDFVALFYLLKVPIEVVNLKGILVSPNGWANAATIDIIYDLLHMMGRDDIPVGLGDLFGINQTDPIVSSVCDCKYNKAIPHGSGGLLDSDTLYGLARLLPRSPKSYTAENSVEYGAPRDTDHPELRQPLAMETWRAIVESLDPGEKISVLTNGPLTNLAKIVLSGNTSSIQEIFIVGGHLSCDESDKGDVINVPANKYAEMNVFLDPLAAKTVLESELNITLVPLDIQRSVSKFSRILKMLNKTNNTGEVLFVKHLLSRLHRLKRSYKRYQHMDIFLGEILGAVMLANIDHPVLKPDFELQHVKVHADGDESQDGQITMDEKHGRPIRVLKKLDIVSYYDLFAERLGDEKQSAVVESFSAQKRMWSKTLGSF